MVTRHIVFGSLLLACACALPAQSPAAHDLYLDPSQPIDRRVDDLVSRMTLAEKVSQMQSDAPAIPRLHVAQYDWWNEGLHGVARSGYATLFPQAIGLAATWDTTLIHSVADVISTEARAKYNDAQRHDNHSIFYGLTLWSPNINILRDPRWGRGQETYGEDPFLTGQIGTAFVEGLQGDDPRYLKVVATAKHFAVHSGPESERHTFDAVISPHDLADTYLPAFRELLLNAHAASLMCAYNSIDGAPACANTMLLQQTVGRDWNFRGYIVSDCAAISDINGGHHFAPDLPHAAAAAVLAGTDLSCGKEFAALIDAVHQGLINEASINASVKRLFNARFRLGMFDPPSLVPYNAIPFTENDSPAQSALALKTARASMVLLKNDASILPLSKSPKTIAVVGPNAAALPALEGNYNAVAAHPVTPLAALERRMPDHILYAQGSPYADGIPLVVPETLFATQRDGQGKRGLTAEYFDGAAITTHPAVTRIDRQIDFDWNGSAPVAGVSSKSFAVRWTGSMTPPATGTLTFSFSMAHCSTCDDAETVKVWLDDKQVYDFNHATTHGRRAPTPPFDLIFRDTRPHALRIEYTHTAPHFGAGLTFNWKPPIDELRREAVAAATHADLTVAFMGLSPELEGEEMPLHVDGFNGGDRTSIEMPSAQRQLIAALAATGKPLILVLMNGSAIALHGAEKQAAAILEAWYPGEAGGTALADTIFGDNNPSGRLPITFYAATSQLPPFNDYAMQGRTYRYFTGVPLYPFGYGLSYTHFQYTAGHLSSTSVHAGSPLTLTVDVTNAGQRDGKETVEVYLVPKNPGQTSIAPRRSLVAFQKLSLHAGETKTISSTMQPRQLSTVAADGTRSMQAGEYELFVGGSQPTPAAGLSLPFTIDGSATLAP